MCTVSVGKFDVNYLRHDGSRDLLRNNKYCKEKHGDDVNKSKRGRIRWEVSHTVFLMTVPVVYSEQ